jgi:hypothetical protein
VLNPARFMEMNLLNGGELVYNLYTLLDQPGETFYNRLLYGEWFWPLSLVLKEARQDHEL